MEDDVNETLRAPVAILNEHASKQADALFIQHVASDARISYLEAWNTALKLHFLLEEYRVARKARVVFAVRNHWLIYPLLVACCSRRATLVPLDPELHRDELAFILNDAAPALIIHHDDVKLPLIPGRAGTMSLSRLKAALEAIVLPEEGLAEGEAQDVALMIYTSGTTGTNKCVMLSQQNLCSNAQALAQRYRITAADRFFCTLPTHHMNALMITGMLPMLAGASIVLADILSFKNAKLFWKLLDEHAISVCSLVPSIMALLLKLFPSGAGKAERLRFAFCGAAPLSAQLWQQFEEVFQIPVYQGYGLTETTCWAVSIPMDNPRPYATVGLPLEGITIKIAPWTADGESLLFEEASLAAERENQPLSGEILIGGPIVSPGYYKNPKLSKDSLSKDGYFRTGDLGYFDQDGFLHVSGRLKEIIIKNGANIFSQDLDRILLKHPAVREAKSFGMRDELVGERIYCICVLEDAAAISEIELRTWLQAQLSQAMWPDAVLFMGYLPAGAAGKVSTNTLRKLVSGAICDEMLQALNSWKYKRAQASGVEQIRQQIQKALLQGHPIGFLSYWGCGTRSGLSENDRLTLERLRDYLNGVRRIAQAPPKMTLIFTDMHARNNRIPQERMDAYFSAIRDYADGLGMTTCLLSEIWKDSGLEVSAIQATLSSEDFQRRWQAEPLRARLIDQAGKHVEGGSDPEAAAQFYYLACEREGQAVARRWPEHIFTSFNHPDFDCVSPPLPKVYLYSFKEGTSIKPWFVD